MKSSNLRVKDIMTADPFIAKPVTTIQEAAKRMKMIDCGVLPVGDVDKIIGIITDRDITLRVTAEGKDPVKTHVDEVMTKKVYSCDEDDKIEDAAEKMREHGVVRLVVTKNKKVTGIVNATELLRNNGDVLKSDKVLHDLLGCGLQQKQMAGAKHGGCC